MFHKEGYQIIMLTFVITVAIAILAEYKIDFQLLRIGIQIIVVFMLLLVLQFFRNPKRITPRNKNLLIAPVDGKVVIIEEVYEKEEHEARREGGRPRPGNHTSPDP